jgi:KRAB domain-containing zinc finger protein
MKTECEIDIENVCRACNQENENLSSIFTLSHENVAFQHLLHLIAPIPMILEDDGLPYKICEPCRERAKEAYNFRQMLLNSDENMRAACGVVHIKEEFDPDEMFHEVFTNEDFENASNGFRDDEYEDIKPLKKKFQCAACGEFHESASKLLQHLNSHTELSEEDKSEMLGHAPKKEYKPRPRKFKCTLCTVERCFTSPSKLSRHLQSALHRDTPKEIKSQIISDSITEKKLPKDHRLRKHKCDQCSKAFASPWKLGRHMNVHNKDEPDLLQGDAMGEITCEKCPKNFSSKVAYQRHLFTHNPVFEASKLNRDESMPFTCVICTKPSNDYNDNLTHMRTHDEDGTAISCKLCSKNYFSIKGIIRHSKTHPENATHQCIHCGKKFGYGEDFVDHMLRHEDLKIFACDLCPKSFVRLHKLRQHMKIHANNGKPFLCSECGKAFADVGYLRRHQMRHSEIKPFKCEFCPASFVFRGDYKRHAVTHSGAKPFVCNICGSTFSR